MAPSLPKTTGSKRRVRRPLRSPTLARFVLDQLAEAGVGRVFGIPGDFILRLCQVIEEAAAEVVGRIVRARRPVLVVGVEVHRFRLASRVVALAEALGLPVVTSFMGRGSFPDDHPQYAGTYLGPASPPGVRELVEESDWLVMLGALLSDTNMGVRLRALDPRHLVLAVSREVRDGFHRYDDVPLEALVEAMIEGSGDGRGVTFRAREGRPPFLRADDEPSPGPIRVASMIAEINRFFAERGEMPLVTDTGDCLFCSHQIDTPSVVASAYYATMGFGVPAAMGFEAATGRRPLVLVGDGGFQMTGWELLHARRWEVAPIVVVMNNGSWEMLQAFLPAGYNALPEGRFAEAVALWGVEGLRAPTAADLRRALHRAADHDGPVLIEVPLARGDISETLATFTRSVGTTPPPG